MHQFLILVHCGAEEAGNQVWVNQVQQRIRGAYLLLAEQRQSLGSDDVVEKSRAALEENRARRDKGGLGAFLVEIEGLLTGAFVRFAGRKDVKATFETRDPTPRWTDACPLPILAMTFALGLAAASCLLGLMYSIVPLFGLLLTGLPAVVILLLLAAFLAFLTIQTYRRRPQAWFSTLGLVVVGGLSQIITFTVHDLNDLYAAMGYSQEMLDMMSQITERMPMNIPLMSGAYAGVLLALLLYVRRFFDFAPAQDDSTPDDA